jgi:hypothetical protein
VASQKRDQEYGEAGQRSDFDIRELLGIKGPWRFKASWSKGQSDMWQDPHRPKTPIRVTKYQGAD